MKWECQRDIRNWESAPYLEELIRSLFVTELLSPSKELFLISPWVTDIPVLDNRAGQFHALAPQLGCGHLTLVQVLSHLVERGTHVYVETNCDHHNRAFSSHMQGVSSRFPDRVSIREREKLHEKGLLGASYYLCGSFNFTFSGIHLNEEVAHYYTGVPEVDENYIQIRARWDDNAP